MRSELACLGALVVRQANLRGCRLEAVVERQRSFPIAGCRAVARGVGERPVAQRIVAQFGSRFVAFGGLGKALEVFEHLAGPLGRKAL